MLSRLFLVLVTLFLIYPCQGCDRDNGVVASDCVNLECGTYDMNGPWTADVHRELWTVGPDGERLNEQVDDIPARLLFASTGCGVTINKAIPALATDENLIIHSDYDEPFDVEGNYSYSWSWRGDCSIEECFLDGTVIPIIAGEAQPTQRGLFTYTNLKRFGE